MCSLDQYVIELEKLAPLNLSEEMIKKGCYDNSGIIIRTHDNVENVLFSLDLTESVVNRAKRLKCDTIVTHHPAIYSPINQLDLFDVNTKAVTLATKLGLNVVSFHLNLDVAKGGIDDCIWQALDGIDAKIIDKIDQENGYGRAFCVPSLSFIQLVKKVKDKFKTNKVIAYGGSKKEISKIATFCGAGGSEALKAISNGIEADAVISSDLKHNIIVGLVERGACVIELSHYASENFGFKRFYERALAQTKINAYYFEDKRFL